MKTMTKLTALVLVAVMLLVSMVSCGSSFGTIKKNFEDAGYTYVESSEDGADTAHSITAELEQGNISCTAHFFKSTSVIGTPAYCMVLEFGSDKELAKAFEEEGSATLKGMIADAQESKYVRDNCVLVVLSILKAEEMIETFNK